MKVLMVLKAGLKYKDPKPVYQTGKGSKKRKKVVEPAVLKDILRVRRLVKEAPGIDGFSDEQWETVLKNYAPNEVSCF